MAKSRKSREPLTACVAVELAAQVRAAARKAGVSVHAWVRAAVLARLRGLGVEPSLAEALLPYVGRAALAALDAARFSPVESPAAALVAAIRLLAFARKGAKR